MCIENRVDIEHFAKRTRVVAMDPRAQAGSSKATEGLYPAGHALFVDEAEKFNRVLEDFLRPLAK